jgi:hypothetical protein
MLKVPPSLHVHEYGVVRCGGTLGFTPPMSAIHAKLQRTTVGPNLEQHMGTPDAVLTRNYLDIWAKLFC